MLNPNLRHCGYARKESFFAGLRHANAQLASTLSVWGEGGQGPRDSCQKELFFADTGLQKMGTLYLPKTSTLKQTTTLHCMLVWEYAYTRNARACTYVFGCVRANPSADVNVICRYV